MSAPAVDLLRLQRLFDQAIILTGGARRAFLDERCPRGTPLRSRLERLLAAGDAEARIRTSPVGTSDEHRRHGSSAVPLRIDGYGVIEVVGQGGMGTVYRARQEGAVRREVAIKVVPAGWATDRVLKRFEREREALAAMNHDHIARVYDAGATDDGRPYLVMELVSGVPFDRYCCDHALDLRARIRLLQQVCAGVQHAHQKGVFHRDLKPSNVLVTEVDGMALAKVIDFGLARADDSTVGAASLVTLQGALLGTPEYMSPEQATGDPRAVDARTDIYSLGVMLYELLCGALPFDPTEIRALGPLGLQRLLAEREPQRPSSRIEAPSGARAVRGDLDWIVARAMAKEPARRYASPADLGADLQRHLDGEPVVAARPSRAYVAAKFVRRNRGATITVAAVLLCLCAGLVAAWLGLQDAQRSRNRELAARVREQQTTDPLRAADLLRRAAGSWPAEGTLAANRAAIDAWISECDSVLDRLERHRVALRRARTAEAAVVRATSTVEPTALVSDPEQLRALRTMLEAEPELRAWRGRVAARGGVLERHWPLWTLCRDSLEGVAGFEAVDVSPLPHLIPLGIDRDRDTTLGRQVAPLWLFAVGGTGAVPAWVDVDSGVAVPYGTPGRAVIEEDTALLLVLLPGGTFWRGTQTEDPSKPNYDDLPRLPGTPLEHTVPVTRIAVEPFLLAKTEVTRAQYALFARASGRPPAGTFGAEERGDFAARGITFREASAFCEWAGLVLPSETQWEYAARAGTTTAYWSGPDEASLARVGWYQGNAAEYPRPVGVGPLGEGAPNPWGLHDVHGGVREWCADGWFRGWQLGRQDDRAYEPDTAATRLVRGGAFDLPAHRALAGFRKAFPPSSRYPSAGFRPSVRLASTP